MFANEEGQQTVTFNPAFPWIYLSPSEFDLFQQAFRTKWSEQKFKCDDYYGECRLGKRCSEIIE